MKPNQEDVEHNLGKCPNKTQARRLSKFRQSGLWDYSVQRRTNLTCPIKYLSASDDSQPEEMADAKSVDKLALILSHE